MCRLTHAQVRLLPRPLREWHAFLAVFFNLTSPLFFLGCNLGVSWGKGGEFWGSLLSKVSLLLSHAFDLTCKLQCKFHCGQREWAGECTPWAGSVCVHMSVNRKRDYCLHAPSCPPPAARSCLGYLLWCWFLFLVMKMFPSDRTGFTKFCMQVWIRTKGCVCVCVCSHWVCLCCITKEWGTHVPSSF